MGKADGSGGASIGYGNGGLGMFNDVVFRFRARFPRKALEIGLHEELSLADVS